MGERIIAHLNIIGFKATVAAIKDKSLRFRPFVIAESASGRSIAYLRRNEGFWNFSLILACSIIVQLHITERKYTTLRAR
jgi:hypothetical protein